MIYRWLPDLEIDGRLLQKDPSADLTGLPLDDRRRRAYGLSGLCLSSIVRGSSLLDFHLFLHFVEPVARTDRGVLLKSRLYENGFAVFLDHPPKNEFAREIHELQ